MNKSDLKSLDFPVDGLFMKLFKTVNIEIVRQTETVSKNFGFELPSVILDAVNLLVSRPTMLV